MQIDYASAMVILAEAQTRAADASDTLAGRPPAFGSKDDWAHYQAKADVAVAQRRNQWRAASRATMAFLKVATK